MSSTTEGFGLPGLEAAASHCPVVATRCGGPEDYVHDGETGYLVEVGDVEQMARRILDVVRLPEPSWREMSSKSYELARGFRWEHSAERLERALLDALARESGSSS